MNSSFGFVLTRFNFYNLNWWIFINYSYHIKQCTDFHVFNIHNWNKVEVVNWNWIIIFLDFYPRIFSKSNCVRAFLVEISIICFDNSFAEFVYFSHMNIFIKFINCFIEERSLNLLSCCINQINWENLSWFLSWIPVSYVWFANNSSFNKPIFHSRIQLSNWLIASISSRLIKIVWLLYWWIRFLLNLLLIIHGLVLILIVVSIVKIVIKILLSFLKVVVLVLLLELILCHLILLVLVRLALKLLIIIVLLLLLLSDRKLVKLLIDISWNLFLNLLIL